MKSTLYILSLACTAANLWLIHRAGGWETLALCIVAGSFARFFVTVAQKVPT